MARILVVGINYAPENIGTGKYTSEMCEWLANHGHEVRMVCAPPYYPAWKVWDGFKRMWFQREIRNGVDVVRCPLWVPEKPSGLTRLLHLGSFGISSAFALLHSLAWKPQRIVAISPTMTSAPAVWLAARLTGAKSWLHIQDFELDAMLDMGIVKADSAKQFALILEKWLLRRFDRVSTISPKMLQRLSNKGVDTRKQVLFPNWADIDLIHPLASPSPYRTELGIPDDAVIALYSGNMGLKQGLELLGEAALRLEKIQNLYFVFGGQGPGRELLETACAHLPNVRFLGLQPLDRLNDWLGLADIHLLPQRADVADLVMPSKLTGMLASGRPVLATALPDTGVAVALRASGICTPPGDAKAFSDQLQQLASDTALRNRLGAAARKQAEETLAKNAILNHFQQVLLAP